ncbi:hypothetical protein GCM10022631_07230 [Deinococcus rubellus]|uniref:hypothetical protein n=1 Tax=Deinococcus rubellus TaxID=1889240 RepID=UPI0031ECE521
MKNDAAYATIRLSSLLRPLPNNEVCLIVSGYTDALLEGVIEAMPEQDQTFDLVYLNEQGQETTAQLNEEFVVVTDEMTRWLAAQQLASRYLIMTNTRTLHTTEERLKNQLDDLRAMAQIRRDALKKDRAAQAAKGGQKAKGPSKATKKSSRSGSVSSKNTRAKPQERQDPTDAALAKPADLVNKPAADAQTSISNKAVAAPQINAEDHNTDLFLNT